MTKRRQRIDSSTAAVKSMQAAGLQVPVPDHLPLTDQDLPFWQNIIAEKAKAEWSAHDLELAALLAQSLRKMRDEELTLDGEGSVITVEGRNPTANPRLTIIKDLHARVIKYRQTLGIHDRGKNGEARDSQKRREQARGIETQLDDDLLARPTSMQ